jgi:hypothetical protein
LFFDAIHGSCTYPLFLSPVLKTAIGQAAGFVKVDRRLRDYEEKKQTARTIAEKNYYRQAKTIGIPGYFKGIDECFRK